MRFNLLPSRHLGSLLLILTMVGCQESPSPQKKSSVPFVFKSLELRHKQADGSRDWDLHSPLARYELGRRATISAFQKQQTNVNANPVSTNKIDNS